MEVHPWSYRCVDSLVAHILVSFTCASDQAVKTLFEIWHPEDIPCVFISPLKSLYNPPSQSLISTVAEMYNAIILLKNFVHEVLKCSRTSGSIMQTALC